MSAIIHETAVPHGFGGVTNLDGAFHLHHTPAVYIPMGLTFHVNMLIHDGLEFCYDERRAYRPCYSAAKYILKAIFQRLISIRLINSIVLASFPGELQDDPVLRVSTLKHQSVSSGLPRLRQSFLSPKGQPENRRVDAVAWVSVLSYGKMCHKTCTYINEWRCWTARFPAGQHEAN